MATTGWVLLSNLYRVYLVICLKPEISFKTSWAGFSDSSNVEEGLFTRPTNNF